MTSDRERAHHSELHREWCDPECDGVDCELLTDILKHEAAIRKETAEQCAELVREHLRNTYGMRAGKTALMKLADQIAAIGEGDG